MANKLYVIFIIFFIALAGSVSPCYSDKMLSYHKYCWANVEQFSSLHAKAIVFYDALPIVDDLERYSADELSYYNTLRIVTLTVITKLEQIITPLTYFNSACNKRKMSKRCKINTLLNVEILSEYVVNDMPYYTKELNLADARYPQVDTHKMTSKLKSIINQFKNTAQSLIPEQQK